MTWRGIPATLIASGFLKDIVPPKTEGAGNAGRSMRPQPRVQNKKARK
jgi:hypothetical protein